MQTILDFLCRIGFHFWEPLDGDLRRRCKNCATTRQWSFRHGDWLKRPPHSAIS